MHSTLVALQLIVSILLVLCILVQVKGNGFGRVWGSGASSFTRRGLEAVVFKTTFVLAFVYLSLSLAIFLV